MKGFFSIITTPYPYLTSSNAKELFELGKVWIINECKTKEITIQRIKVSPKTIGRNQGFIIDVFPEGRDEHIRYYAKIQSFHMDTVMLHYLLKYSKCGPEEFLIVLLTSHDKNDYFNTNKHGVITKEVESCKMASAWREIEVEQIGSSEKFFRTESFLVTLFAAFGRFGNLPHNRDNWGFAQWKESLELKKDINLSCLMIIDFSSGGDNNFNRSYSDFILGWIIHTIIMCQLGSHVANPDNEALGKYISTFFPEGNAIWREAVNIDWMISQQALLRMLQKVCNATERWIVDTVRTCYTSTNATYSINENDDSFLDAHTVEFPLASFRFVGKPENNYQLRELLFQYEQWIETWNEQLSSLFT